MTPGRYAAFERRCAALSQRQRTLVALAISLVCTTLPFVEVLVGRRTMLWGDAVAAYVPRYAAAWDNIRSGTSPLWWGRMFGGFNTLGAGQSAIFYLPNAVFGWLAPFTAFRVWFFVHLWLMTAGWYAWAWRRWGSLTGAVVVAVGGTLNGFVIYHSMFLPYVVGLTVLPWSFLALDAVIASPRLRNCALLSLLIGAMALQLTQLMWIALIALGGCAIFELVRRKGGLMPWIRVGGSLVLGVALGAVQLVSQVSFSDSSVRPRLSEAAAFEFASEPKHLTTLLVPGLLGGTGAGPIGRTTWLGGSLQHELANYLGITMVALAVIGVMSLRRHRLSLALIVLGVLGVLTALGGRTPLGSLVYDWVPLASRFRAWSRNLLWTNVAVAMLAGAGVREFLRAPQRWAARILRAGAAFALVMLLLPTLTDLGGSMLHGGPGMRARFLPVVFVLLLGCVGLLIARSRLLGMAALAAVCALDLGLFAIAAPWRTQSLPAAQVSETFDDGPPPFGAPVDAPGGIDRWASDIADASAFWPSVIGHHSRSINGYDPLLQRDYSATLGGMAYNGYMPEPNAWQAGWIPDILRATTWLGSGYAAAPGSAWTYQQQFDSYAVYTYTPRLAETYLVGEAKVRSLDEARAGIYDPNTPLTEFAYVDTGTITSRDTPRFAELAQPGASGTVVDGAMDDGGHGTWTVSAERPSLFVTSYAWMDGWTATVDGKPVPVARTNALVLGVPVPAGQHEVQLTFTPPGWTTGRNVTIVAAVLVLALLVADTRRARAQWARLRSAARSRRKAPTATSISG